MRCPRWIRATTSVSAKSSAPPPYEIVLGRGKEWRNTPTPVPIYRLDEGVPESDRDFNAKRGDILLGGGGGEAPAMHISMPEVFWFSTGVFVDGKDDVWHGWDTYEEIVEAYRSNTDAFTFGAGYVLLGWNPEEHYIEHWLMEHVLAFLVREYPDEYAQYVGWDAITQDGSICQRLSPEDRAFFDQVRDDRKRRKRAYRET